MAKYEILEEFVMNGITQRVGDIVELDYVKANLKSIQSKIKLTTVVAAPKGQEALAAVVPGQPLTEEQKEKLRVENAAASADAHAMAANQRARDLAQDAGQAAVPAVAKMLQEKLLVVSEAIKEKPLNEEFQGTPPPNLPEVPEGSVPPVA